MYHSDLLRTKQAPQAIWDDVEQWVGIQVGNCTELQLSIMVKDGSVPLYTYTYDELADLDARLPEVLRSIMPKEPGGVLDNKMLRTMLSFWKDDVFYVPVAALAASNMPISDVGCNIGAVHSADLTDKGHLRVVFNNYFHTRLHTGVVYAGGSLDRTAFIDSAWLDVEVPHWRRHLELASSLGLSGTLLRDALFHTKSEPDCAARLPGDVCLDAGEAP